MQWRAVWEGSVRKFANAAYAYFGELQICEHLEDAKLLCVFQIVAVCVTTQAST